MTFRRLCIVAALLCCLLAVACNEPVEQKSLDERLLELSIKRCKQLAPKGHEGECETPAGSTTLEANNNLHRVIVKQITDIFPTSTAVCSKHGSFLICKDTLLEGKPRNIVYRLDDAKDGSDSQTIYVWSQER